MKIKILILLILSSLSVFLVIKYRKSKDEIKTKATTYVEKKKEVLNDSAYHYMDDIMPEQTMICAKESYGNANYVKDNSFITKGYNVVSTYRITQDLNIWSLMIKTKCINGYMHYIVQPFLVCYRNKNAEKYISIDTAIKNAYDYYVSDKQSIYSHCLVDIELFNKVNLHEISDHYKVDDTWEEYFASPFAGDNWIRKNISYEVFRKDLKPCFITDDYYVFLSTPGAHTYKIVLDEQAVERDKNNCILKETELLNKRAIILALILLFTFLVLLTNLITSYINSKKTILQRLIKLSNPKNYVRQHDEVKLRIANRIYSKAIRLTDSSEKEIIELATELETELGVTLINDYDIEKLKKRCNPKYFMNPYDPPKVDLASTIYPLLFNRNMKLKEYLDIETTINKSLS